MFHFLNIKTRKLFGKFRLSIVCVYVSLFSPTPYFAQGKLSPLIWRLYIWTNSNSRCISFEKNSRLALRRKFFKTRRFALKEVSFFVPINPQYYTLRFLKVHLRDSHTWYLFIFFFSLSEPGSSGWQLQSLAFRQTNKYVSNEPLIVSSMIYHEAML